VAVACDFGGWTARARSIGQRRRKDEKKGPLPSRLRALYWWKFAREEDTQVPHASVSLVYRHLRRWIGRGDDASPDHQLLERFVAGRAEAAFAALVERQAGKGMLAGKLSGTPALVMPVGVLGIGAGLAPLRQAAPQAPLAQALARLRWLPASGGGSERR
jgi:hypothetical protein